MTQKMKRCRVCEVAANQFGRLILDIHVVQVKVDGKLHEVVLWADALHTSCNHDCVEDAKADGAVLWPAFAGQLAGDDVPALLACFGVKKRPRKRKKTRK